MILLDLVRAYQTPQTLVMVIFGPQILGRGVRYLSNRNRPASTTSSPHPPRASLSTQLKAFLALHTLYHLLHLMIPPYDLFSTPHLPILAPNDLLRSRLSPASSGTETTNPLIDMLLTRLRDLDTRLLYLRFGHATMQGCLWCRTPLDYFIVSLPDIMARYVWAAIVLICLGSERLAGPGANTRARRWGAVAVWAVGLACVVELGARYFWDLRVTEGDCLHVSFAILRIPLRQADAGIAFAYHTLYPNHLPPCHPAPAHLSTTRTRRAQPRIPHDGAAELAQYAASDLALARDDPARRPTARDLDNSRTDGTRSQGCGAGGWRGAGGGTRL